MQVAVVNDFHVAREHPYVVVIPLSHRAASLGTVDLRNLSNKVLVTSGYRARTARWHSLRYR
jgi:hypothetical protein